MTVGLTVCRGRRLLRLYIKCYSGVKIDKNKIRQARKQSNSWLSSMYKKAKEEISSYFCTKKERNLILLPRSIVQ